MTASQSARAPRHDGWTPRRIRIFLDTLSQCGVVADAARAAGISVRSAYRFRNRREGRHFHLAWNAAILLGRRCLADSAMSRAMHGWTETIRRGGEVWGERNRYDNRLTMAVLTRLDRQALGYGEENSIARTVAEEFEDYVDLVCKGEDEAADAFLAARHAPRRARVATRSQAPHASAAPSRPGGPILACSEPEDVAEAGWTDWREETESRGAVEGVPVDPSDKAEPATGACPEPVEGACPEPVEGPLDLSHIYLDSIPGWHEADALLCLRSGLFERMDSDLKAEFEARFSHLMGK